MVDDLLAAGVKPTPELVEIAAENGHAALAEKIAFMLQVCNKS